MPNLNFMLLCFLILNSPSLPPPPKKKEEEKIYASASTLLISEAYACACV
jgi:hypothetical protein